MKTFKDQAVRNQLEQLTIIMGRLTSRPSCSLYGLCRILLKMYTYEVCVETLSRMQPGFPIGYYRGALRNEAVRKNGITNKAVLDLAETF